MVARARHNTPELGVMDRACLSCTLKELCWPIGLDPDYLEQVQAMIRHVGPLPAGSHLFHTGDPFTAMYAVRSGCIKSYTVDAGGHEFVHGFHLGGEILGFDAVYPDRHRSSAVVLEAASLCSIPYRDIARLSPEFQNVHDQVLRLMSREFSRQLTFAAGPGATQRLAHFLLDMHARLLPPGTVAYQYTLPMSREDISNYLRITPETLSRLFAKLQKKGLIDVDRRQVFLSDPARLDMINQGVS